MVLHTKEHQRKAGWGRARQHAHERRLAPSPAEAKVQEILRKIGATFETEHEINHPDGMPQWVDIWVLTPSVLAVEVDGSHGWHNYDGKDDCGKMAKYDELKTRLLGEMEVPLLCINGCAHDHQIEARLREALKE